MMDGIRIIVSPQEFKYNLVVNELYGNVSANVHSFINYSLTHSLTHTFAHSLTLNVLSSALRLCF